MRKYLLGGVQFLLVFNVNASVIYSYTGNNFDSFFSQNNSAELIDPIYDTSMQVTGFVELETFLSPNLTGVSLAPINAIFSDGLFTISYYNGSPRNSIIVSTNESGNIIDWTIILTSELDILTFGEVAKSITALPAFDQGGHGYCIDTACSVIESHEVYVMGKPGAWSVVPIPAGFWLFGSGLVGLIGIARRKNS
jgi:hypothetical protein